MIPTTTCQHCGREIIPNPDPDAGLYGWIDPLATGDDAIWSETCDAHDTFTAEHEPATTEGDSSADRTPMSYKVEGTMYALFDPTTPGEVSGWEFVPFHVGRDAWPTLPPSPAWQAIDLYLEQTLGNMQVQWNEDDSPAGD